MEPVTSPLTTIESISTPESFYTAKDDSDDAGAGEGDITRLSTPDDEEQKPYEHQKLPFRDARVAPRELNGQCHSYLEDSYCKSHFAPHLCFNLVFD